MSLQRTNYCRLTGIAVWSSLALLGLTACAGHETVKSRYVGTASMSTDQVRRLLNDQGYTQVTGLHENGPDWIGNAKKEGRLVSFDIAPNGTIHTK